MGASPRMSTTSNDAVFWPSMRNSFTEFTTSTPGRVPSSRTIVSASSKLPWIGTSCAPWMSACASLPNAMWPGGQHHAARQPRARRVRRGGRRRVAGGRADRELGASLDRDRHRHRHPAVFERRGGIETFDLQPHLGNAGALRDSGCVEQRRVALEQRDHGRRLGHGEVLAVLLDHAPPRSDHSSSPMTRSTDPTRCTASTFCNASTVLRTSASRALCVTKISRASSPDAALVHRPDRHTLAAELGRDRREHSRAVGHLDQEIEL